jgi:hypothetical protein
VGYDPGLPTTQLSESEPGVLMANTIGITTFLISSRLEDNVFVLEPCASSIPLGLRLLHASGLAFLWTVLEINMELVCQ